MLWKFFIENIPSWSLIGWLAPISIIYAFAALYFCGWLKKRHSWRTGYTRKLFHFDIFIVAGVVQVLLGYQGTIVFGSSVSLVIFYAVWKGEGNLLFEAMAREKDAPERALYILMPYFATMIGGVLCNFLFTPAVAVYGYLVTGLGDAIAEPVGTRFGKHKYRVPSVKNVTSHRTLEGSTAVFAGSFIALVLANLLAHEVIDEITLLVFFGISAGVTLTEAVSPHGWDNFTLQVMTCLMVFFLVV